MYNSPSVKRQYHPLDSKLLTPGSNIDLLLLGPLSPVADSQLNFPLSSPSYLSPSFNRTPNKLGKDDNLTPFFSPSIFSPKRMTSTVKSPLSDLLSPYFSSEAIQSQSRQLPSFPPAQQLVAPSPQDFADDSHSTETDHDTSFCSTTTDSEIMSDFYPSPEPVAHRQSSSIILSPPTDEKGGCNCKKSKCLKLYCECFAALRYCENCNCSDCNNVKEKDVQRQEAIKQTKERNINAFQRKITVRQGHASGCNCKQSQCLKKYCECFQGSAFCGTNCKCKSCMNYEGSKVLSSARSEIDGSAQRDRRKKESSGGILGQIDHSNSSLISQDSEDTLPLSTQATTALVPSLNLRPPSSPLNTIQFLSPVFSNRPQRSLPPPFPLVDPSSATLRPLKKRKVKFAPPEVVTYHFFGETLPSVQKIVALRCLLFLDGKDLYSMSMVNSLWNSAVHDEALWEEVD